MASVTHSNVGFTLRSSTVRIEPPRGLLGLRSGEVWDYRELLYFFVWRDVKIRYKQTAIGVLWVALQPVLTIPFVIQFWMLPLLSPTLLRSFPRAFAGFMD
jgi:ABC-type polysaccharide/polyol phosphate export permease